MMAEPNPTESVAAKISAACELAMLFRVLPVAPNAKRPMLNDWVNAASSRKEEIEAWFNAEPNAGIGIRCGQLANGDPFFVVDLDEHDPNKSGRATLAELEAAHGELPPTVRAVTPSGGAHLYLRVPAGRPTPRNDAGRRLGPGVDIRGEGGQVVAPPTRLKTGDYSWQRSPADNQIAEAPAWLMDLLADPPATEIPLPALPASSSTSPADWYSAHASWPQLLSAAGWTSDARNHVTRPGKDRRDGHSGVLHPESGVLVVFTTELSPELERMGKPTADGTGLSFTPFSFLAATQYGADLAAAARAVRAQMPAEPAGGVPGLPAEQLAPGEDSGGASSSRGWEPVDLDSATDESLKPPPPTVLVRTDGVALLDKGKVSTILGKPGCGKTWVGVEVVAQALKADKSALVLDFEDCLSTWWLRLRAVGVEPEQIKANLAYVHPEMWATSEDLEALRELVIQRDTEVVVLDSTGESMGMGGFDQNDDPSVAKWMRQVARRLAQAGPAVLLLDHLPKDSPDVGAWPIGSQRKLASADGRVLAMVTRTPFAIGVAGYAELVLIKDRSGYFAKDQVVARFAVSIVGDSTAFSLEPTVEVKRTPGGVIERPTVVMEKLSRELEAWPREALPPTQATLASRIGGRKALVCQGLDALEASGYVASSKAPRGGKYYRSETPYRAEAEELATLVGEAPPVPGTAREQVGTGGNSSAGPVPTCSAPGGEGDGNGNRSHSNLGPPGSVAPGEIDLFRPVPTCSVNNPGTGQAGESTCSATSVGNPLGVPRESEQVDRLDDHKTEGPITVEDFL